MDGKSRNWRGGVVGLVCRGYSVLYHLGCLWTLILIGVGGSVVMYRRLICRLVVICSSFDSRFGMFIVAFLWCMHRIRGVSVLMRGPLFSSGGIVGSVYFMLSGMKCLMTCVSSNVVCMVCHLWFILHLVWWGWWLCFGFLLQWGMPNRWLFVYFLGCVDGHIQYLTICGKTLCLLIPIWCLVGMKNSNCWQGLNIWLVRRSMRFWYWIVLWFFLGFLQVVYSMIFWGGLCLDMFGLLYGNTLSVVIHIVVSGLHPFAFVWCEILSGS